MPPADPPVHRALSRIAGHGLFATSPLAPGTVVVRVEQPPRTVDDLGSVNHSCEPNLGWSHELTLVTTRDIAEGEELTLDYATCIVDDGFVLWCHCETYRCRQVIEGSDWRIPQLQSRYAGTWHPSVAELIAR